MDKALVEKEMQTFDKLIIRASKFRAREELAKSFHELGELYR